MKKLLLIVRDILILLFVVGIMAYFLAEGIDRQYDTYEGTRQGNREREAQNARR